MKTEILVRIFHWIALLLRASVRFTQEIENIEIAKKKTLNTTEAYSVFFAYIFFTSYFSLLLLIWVTSEHTVSIYLSICTSKNIILTDIHSHTHTHTHTNGNEKIVADMRSHIRTYMKLADANVCIEVDWMAISRISTISLTLSLRLLPIIKKNSN